MAAGSAQPADVTQGTDMPELMTEKEVASVLRVQPVEARAILARDGVRIIPLSRCRFRVDAEEFALWLRGPGGEDRRWSEAETATP